MCTVSFIFVAFVAISNALSECYEASEFGIDSMDGVLKVNGTRFNLKAAAWFGFETDNYCVHGLWAVDYHSIVDFMANYSFNGVRIPFSVYLVLNDPAPVSISYYQMNQDLQNLTSLQVLDVLIKAFGDAGIVVMLDMHSLEPGGYMEDGLWYDSKYPQATTLKAWNMMVERYKDQWNVVAADVFNEPFDATWGTGDASTDFNTWCETVGNDMHSNGVDWLIMCEGVATSPPCTDACFWGEDLQGVKSSPVKLNEANKLVYSPHVYGPDVAYQDYFNVASFPSNMPAIWDTHWGYIRAMNGAATTVGEWGGSLSGADETWMNAFASYLVSNDVPDTWFWCVNPDSGDTGGLLEYDWKTPVIPKLNLLAQIQPKPTKITPQSNDKICVDFQ
eukprot:CAMPEP_0201564330 /NCGR_PEP_ID=MMETSP0190_2-20130828/2547_1 /ASSEMBLY_ACC=CAM_ASM_000263 /TAXON_ID=37353 /ORGANISM="Rosalina sp." /LENGTH=389 /DNA_ID=CAMNT_0047980365 /DNA_START=40 /DNA_END=1209 /DNA_ORIENTATION=+